LPLSPIRLGTLEPVSPVLLRFVLATIAVPIVTYGLMPRLHRMLTRRATV